MAAQQAPSGQQGAFGSAMLLQRLQRICGATGFEAAGAAQPGLEKQPVKNNQADQTALRQAPKGSPKSGHRCVGVQPAGLSNLSSKPSSSTRAVRASTTDRAETKSVVAKPALNRTSHMPPDKWSACRAKDSRIWRLSKLRVTARRAWRLGTTHPIQRADDQLSTGALTCSSRPVDKSCAETQFLCAGKGAGPPLTWCSAK